MTAISTLFSLKGLDSRDKQALFKASSESPVLKPKTCRKEQVRRFAAK
tara:strand:- start:138 stop:281 length:144 start_codon:yes stop_codon:yes gene_type:complete